MYYKPINTVILLYLSVLVCGIEYSVEQETHSRKAQLAEQVQLFRTRRVCRARLMEYGRYMLVYH